MIRSFFSSFAGAGPLGGVTFGSVASGPLVGVFAAAVSPALTSAWSDVFSLPTPIVPLELLLPPQPASSAAAASATRIITARVRARASRGGALELFTVAQPNGLRARTCRLVR